MTTPAPIADCEWCEQHRSLPLRYEWYDANADLWHTHRFCRGKCCASWIQARERLPNLGIVTNYPPLISPPPIPSLTRRSE